MRLLMVIFTSFVLFAFSSLTVYFCPVKCSGGSLEKQSACSHPSFEDVFQVSIQVVLPVPAGCDSTAYLADIRQSFLNSYKNEKKIQMSVQGIGIGTWHLHARIMFTRSCKPKNARKRIRDILIGCHERLELPYDENQKFKEYLGQTANLKVKKDTEPFADSGWNVDGSSGEPNAQGVLLRFFLIALLFP
jgi:hypothetical protein